MDILAKAHDFSYLSAEVSKALDDAPGGEKAWVPLRRCLVVSILEHLQHAEGLQLRIVTARQTIDNLLRPIEETAIVEVLEMDLLEPTLPKLVEPIDIDVWGSLSREEKIQCIRDAIVSGERPDWMPDRRAWKRHYPEAYQ